MPPMPAEADAPPDLVTPRTASPAASASRARASSTFDVRHLGIEQIERRQFVRDVRASGSRRRGRQTGRPARRAPWRPRARPGIEAVAFEIVGRNHRLLVADDHAQAEIVALGALRFLDRAVAHLDRQAIPSGPRARRPHRRRRGARRDQTFGEIGEVGLVEKRLHCSWPVYAGTEIEHKAKMWLRAALFNPRLERHCRADSAKRLS